MTQSSPSKNAKGPFTSLRREGAFLLVVRLSAVGLSFLLSAILARSLGLEAFGIYAFALTILSLAAIPVQLGLPALVLREVPRASERRDFVMIKTLLAWGVRRLVLIGLLMGALVFIGAFWLDAPVARAVWNGLPLVVLLALLTLSGAFLRGLHHVALGQISEEVLRPLIFIALLVGVYLAGLSGLSAESATMLHSAVALGAVMLAIFLVLRNAPKEIWRAKRDQPDAAWGAAILSLSLLSALQIVSQNTDILMIGFLRPSSDVGLYRVALSAMALGIFGLRLFDILFGPRMAVLIEQKEMAALGRLAQRTARLSLLASIPVAGIFWIFGAEIIGFFFGHEFSDAAPVLSILLGAQLLVAGLGPAATLLILDRQEKLSVRIVIATIVINIILNAVLIPAYGPIGAAWGTAIALGFKSLALWVLVRVKLGIDSSVLARGHKEVTV